MDGPLVSQTYLIKKYVLSVPRAEMYKNIFKDSSYL
jgi:hypothetical protein